MPRAGRFGTPFASQWMIMVREPFHPDRDPSPTASPREGGRLNLLLSSAGWQPDPWSDRLPRMLEPMGIRSRVALSAEAAERVIESEPVHIAVVDLALPMSAGPDTEESGVRLLQILARLASPPPTVVIKRRRTARDDARELAAALRAGAFAVMDRPSAHRDLENLLEVLRRCMTRHYHDRWPSV